ncbi:MAG: hypothetical protein N2234_10705, partial [Planctomycetota bacterium]|nr:hypothetical protein [Planctomycetota bacterium]
EEDSKSRILLLGMLSADVKKIIDEMKRGGFDPLKVDVDIASAYGALLAAGFKPEGAPKENLKEKDLNPTEEETVVLTALCSNQVMVWLHAGENLRRTRSFFLSSKDVKQQAEKFERELRRTIIAAGMNSTVKKICFAGDFQEDLIREIQSRFHADTEKLTLSEKFGAFLDEESKKLLEQSGLVACGAALKLLGYDPLGLDLRQGELAYMKPFDLIKTSLSCTLTLIFFLLFTTAYAYRFKASRDSTELDAIRKKAAEYYETLLPEPDRKRTTTKVDGIYQEFTDTLKKRKSGERGKTATVSALDALLELGKARQKIGGSFLLENLTVQPGKITVEASVDKVETGDALYNYIDRESKMLIKDVASWNRDPRSGKIVFKYIFRVRTGYGR